MCYRFTLNKRKGKDFKILQITDTQIIDPGQMAFPTRLGAQSIERWADAESNCFRFVRKLIEDSRPDLIVLTGDNVYGSFDANGKNFSALVDLIDGYGVPWTQVFGNHDGETYDLEDPRGAAHPWGKGYDWQMEYLTSRTRNCLFAPGPAGIDSSRHGNFVIELSEEGKPVYELFFFDSHDGVTENYGLTRGQVDWYRSETEAVSSRAGGAVPSIIFQHIPLYQHYLANLTYTGSGVGAVSEGDTVLSNGDWGEFRDGLTYNLPMYREYSEYAWDAIQKSDTRAVCVGHYHTNAARINYKGEGDERAVQLVFGVKSSTFDYGYQLGGTSIVIKDGESDPVILPIYLEQSLNLKK